MAGPPQPTHTERIASLRRILVTTDFSASSQRALSYAVTLARQFHAHIFLAHVLTGADPLEGVDASSSGSQMEREKAERAVAAILSSGRMDGVSHEALIEEGYLWQTLETLIEKNEIDLVVVGARGLERAPNEDIEPTAEMIFRRAVCPVLTVGPATENAPRNASGFKSILFATDFGRAAQHAAPHAFSLAMRFRSRVTLLHVVGTSGDYPEGGQEMVKKTSYIRLTESAPPDLSKSCQVELVVQFGDSAEQILRIAREKNADLIVMGARAGRTLVTHLPQRTAYTVAIAAPCPLLTVKG